jgi:hypothetical protein
MNNYSSAVMEGGLLIPDVETYTSAAVFTLGKSSETTGYWCHGLQVCKIYMLILVQWWPTFFEPRHILRVSHDQKHLQKLAFTEIFGETLVFRDTRVGHHCSSLILRSIKN